MPVFPKPDFAFDYSVPDEVARLREPPKNAGHPQTRKKQAAGSHLEHRQSRRSGKARSGPLHHRRNPQLVRYHRDPGMPRKLRGPVRPPQQASEVLSRRHVGRGGQQQRMAFLYDSRKLTPLEEIGEIAFPPSRYKSIKLPGIEAQFNGFDRTPYLVSFSSGNTSFMFVNVHSFYGNEKPESIARRSLETFAVAKRSDSRKKSLFSFTRELVALGDFNMPKAEPGDPIYKSLTKLGLELPEHSTQIASSISSDARYDQIAFFPETTKRCFTGQKGVFDYDAVIFPDLWGDGNNKKNFRTYLRYYISDQCILRRYGYLSETG